MISCLWGFAPSDVREAGGGVTLNRAWERAGAPAQRECESRMSAAAWRGSSAWVTLRVAATRTPSPSARRPEASAASRSPPWAPMPGASNQASGAAVRTSARRLGVGCADDQPYGSATNLQPLSLPAYIGGCLRDRVCLPRTKSFWKAPAEGLEVWQSTNSPLSL